MTKILYRNQLTGRPVAPSTNERKLQEARRTAGLKSPAQIRPAKKES